MIREYSKFKKVLCGIKRSTLSMNSKEHIQRKRRFWLYLVLIISGMLASFYSGYQVGYENCQGNEEGNSDLQTSLKYIQSMPGD